MIKGVIIDHVWSWGCPVRGFFLAAIMQVITGKNCSLGSLTFCFDFIHFNKKEKKFSDPVLTFNLLSKMEMGMHHVVMSEVLNCFSARKWPNERKGTSKPVGHCLTLFRGLTPETMHTIFRLNIPQVPIFDWLNDLIITTKGTLTLIFAYLRIKTNFNPHVLMAEAQPQIWCDASYYGLLLLLPQNWMGRHVSGNIQQRWNKVAHQDAPVRRILMLCTRPFLTLPLLTRNLFGICSTSASYVFDPTCILSNAGMCVFL